MKATYSQQTVGGGGRKTPCRVKRLSKFQCKYNTTLGNLSFWADEENRESLLLENLKMEDQEASMLTQVQEILATGMMEATKKKGGTEGAM